jgi:hypothetical protein
MSYEAIEDLAHQFILSYLNNIRHKASVIPKVDRGLFPFYWFWPSKISIFKTILDDLAISIDRQISGKEDKTTIRKISGRIEESHFPNLDYSKWPIFQIPQNVHDVIIKGGTFLLGLHPFIIISSGSEIRILKIRIETNARGYPREREFVWFLTSPNKKYLTIDKAVHESELDFWSGLESLIIEKLDHLLSRRITEETFSLFTESMERLRQESIDR